MSDVCLTCSGLIMEHGKSYSYAGPICYCFAQPRVQRPSREQTPAAPSAPTTCEKCDKNGLDPDCEHFGPQVIKPNECISCGSWIGVEAHGPYCPKPAPEAPLVRSDVRNLYEALEDQRASLKNYLEKVEHQIERFKRYKA